MEIRVQTKSPASLETPLLAVGVYEGEVEVGGSLKGVDEHLGGVLTTVLASGDFKGAEGDSALVYSAKGTGPERVALVGLGKREEVNAERLRRAAGSSVKLAAKLKVARVSLQVETTMPPREAGQALAEGAGLAAYVFDEMKSRDGDAPTRVESFTLVSSGDSEQGELEEGARVGAIMARGENLARTLGNLPGNVATPTYLADTAERIAAEHGMKVTILGPAELESEGLHALIAVAKGSDEEPRLIVLEHRKGGSDAAPLVLLGKGLTFDAGGISIKPAQGMEEMKFDMCGGAGVLGAMQAIGELDLAVNVIGIVPSSENLLSGSSMKPGDIVRSHLGKTIEIVNTDAEGRLILADALSYLRRFNPASVVDAATLTGACVIALGHQSSAALGNDDALLERVREAGDRAGQRVWPLPMFEEYREQIKSDYADLKNSGGRAAGTITAAWFLREFVGEFPWVHLDIAGTAYGDGKLSYQSKGSTGVPTRLFVEWVRSYAA